MDGIRTDPPPASSATGGGDEIVRQEALATATRAQRVRKRRRRRTSRRLLWWLLGSAVVVLVLVLLGVDLYARYLPAVRALRDGRDAATQAENILRGDLNHIDHASLEQARALLVQAQDDFGRKSAILESGWIPSLISHTPVLGTQVDAARALRRAGLAGCTLGVDLIPVADAVLPQTGGTGTSTLQRVTVAAEAHQADLDRIVAELDALRAAASEVPAAAHLYGPLASARDTVIRDVPRIEDGVRPAIDLLRILPAAVGPGDHRYLLLLDNPAEERPGGGFIGAVGEVTFNQGATSQVSFRQADFARPLVTSLKAPRALDNYLFAGRPWELADANWSPDFPTSADQVAVFYRLATGRTVDGVIGVDPVALSYVVGILGPVAVPGYPQTVGAQNTLVELNEIINAARPGDPGKAYLPPFGQAMLDRLLHLQLGQAPSVASALIRGAGEKHIILHFNDAALQARVDGAGFGGRVLVPASDALQIVDANLSGGKEDLVVTRSYQLEVALGADGQVTDTLTLTYRNPVVTDPAIKKLDASYAGAYRDYLRVYVPEAAQLLSMTLAEGGPPQTVSPEAVDYELQREAIGFLLVVPPGQEVTLTLRYGGPFADATNGPVQYSLDWTKEIGAAAWPITVAVTSPSGTHRFAADTGRDQRWTVTG